MFWARIVFCINVLGSTKTLHIKWRNFLTSKREFKVSYRNLGPNIFLAVFVVQASGPNSLQWGGDVVPHLRFFPLSYSFLFLLFSLSFCSNSSTYLSAGKNLNVCYHFKSWFGIFKRVSFFCQWLCNLKFIS